MLAAHDRKTVCAPAHDILARKGPENLHKWRGIPGLIMFMALPWRGRPPFLLPDHPALSRCGGHHVAWQGANRAEAHRQTRCRASAAPPRKARSFTPCQTFKTALRLCTAFIFCITDCWFLSGQAGQAGHFNIFSVLLLPSWVLHFRANWASCWRNEQIKPRHLHHPRSKAHSTFCAQSPANHAAACACCCQNRPATANLFPVEQPQPAAPESPCKSLI